jgi:hypothetical protein
LGAETLVNSLIFLELRTVQSPKLTPKIPISAAELKNLDKNIVRLKEKLANNNVKMMFPR